MKLFRPWSIASLFLFFFSCPLPGFELTDILGAPYSSGLISAADQERIAWITYEKGVRNIWTAGSPDFEPVRLTRYTEDDGQRISHLGFTSDGALLLFEKGNNEGANPRSDPNHPEIAIHAIEIATGETWKLANGSGAKIAPDNSQIVYLHEGKLMHKALLASKPEEVDESAEAAESKVLFKARGDIASYDWSPDGSKLAFTSNRGDHSFVGVYDLGQEKIQWISPGVDFDSHPSWSPDGSQLAFFRTAGLKKDEFRSIVESRSVTLWVGDVTDGSARKIWQPDRDNGFFAQMYPDQPLTWAGNGRIVFYSEHEGWMHIYSIDPDGSDLETLTPGTCEAEHSTVSRDGDQLYYSSNCAAGDDWDIDRRHLWRVPTRGGKSKTLTSGKGIETDPVQIGGDTLALRSAGTRRPTGIATVGINGKALSIVFPDQLPPEYPAQQMVEPRQVIFRSADGVAVHGQLFMPPEVAAGGEQPALIFMHGGPIRQMLLGYHYRGEYYAFAYAMNQYMASQGYVVLSVNYRSGIGYGREFRMAEDQGPRGASEYRDIIAAGKYLQALPEVDGSRIGLWGGSYGGLLTAMGLARDSDLFAAGVDLHGVHDWSWRGRDFGNAGWWAIGEELYPLAHKSSPVDDLSYWSSPVLFIHGDDDRNVMFGQTVDLVQRLRANGVTSEVLVFPDEVHSFLLYESWFRAYQATDDFFGRFLMNKP